MAIAAKKTVWQRLDEILLVYLGVFGTQKGGGMFLKQIMSSLFMISSILEQVRLRAFITENSLGKLRPSWKYP